ncbi:hypothetical protein C8J56DRAFT_1164053 [Mycena floridula]|nr:hypothetical protein C8J56DRAFT_1164053 [Mycena floridula]
MEHDSASPFIRTLDLSVQSGLEAMPTELLDEIIAHDEDDIGTLCALALTSKKLRLAAIRRLFTEIHFQSMFDFELWCEMVVLNPQLAETIVKTVRLNSPLPVQRNDKGEMLLNWGSRVFTTLPLENVETVICWGTVPQADLFPNMTRLHLDSCCFANWEELAHLVTGFYQPLKFLRLAHTQIGDDREQSWDLMSSDLGALEELSLTANTKDGLEKLVAHFSITGLRKLELGDGTTTPSLNEEMQPEPPCSALATRLLKGNSASLEELTVDTTGWRHHGYPSEYLDDPGFDLRDHIGGILLCAGPFPALRSLSFWGSPLLASLAGGSSFLYWMPRCPELTIITILINVGKLGDHCQGYILFERWHALLTEHLPNHFPRFQKLVFDFRSMDKHRQLSATSQRDIHNQMCSLLPDVGIPVELKWTNESGDGCSRVEIGYERLNWARSWAELLEMSGFNECDEEEEEERHGDWGLARNVNDGHQHHCTSAPPIVPEPLLIPTS